MRILLVFLNDSPFSFAILPSEWNPNSSPPAMHNKLSIAYAILLLPSLKSFLFP